jgi:hypothetical protein
MKIATAVSIVALFTLTAPLAASAEEPEVAAESAALAWLSLLDAKGYTQTWNEASPLFRERTPQSRWKFDAVRRCTWLGVLRSRKLQSAAFESMVRGAPDGEYVKVRFWSDFASKYGPLIETVIAKKDADGIWRVADYYILAGDYNVGSGAAATCSTGSRVCK